MLQKVARCLKLPNFVVHLQHQQTWTQKQGNLVCTTFARNLLFLNTHTPTKFHLRLYSTSHTHTSYHPPCRKGSLLVRWSLLLEATDGSLLRLRSSMFDATEGVWLRCLSPLLDCSKIERKAVIRDDKSLSLWLPWECLVMIRLEDEP